MSAEGNGREHLSLADVARRTLVIIAMVGGSLLLAIGATLCAFVALSVGWPAAVILIVCFVIYQQFENHALAPVIYSRTVAMSPLTVLLVSLAGAASRSCVQPPTYLLRRTLG